MGAPRRVDGALQETDDEKVLPRSVSNSTDETLCSLCQRRPRVVGRAWCQDCITALHVGLRRRRAAELRLPPIGGQR